MVSYISWKVQYKCIQWSLIVICWWTFYKVYITYVGFIGFNKIQLINLGLVFFFVLLTNDNLFNNFDLSNAHMLPQ